MTLQKFKSPERFSLESGKVLPEIEIAYHTYGTLSPKRDNVIWVCHALTANSDVADWWPHTVERGKFLDPERHFIVCANILGSCYGTTGPLSNNPATGEPYYNTFPIITIRDVVSAHMLLANHLNIDRVKMLIGSSIGGFQVLEWIAMHPGFAAQATIIASAAYAEPWVIALNEAQRMAIEADPTYGQRSPQAGQAGLRAARAMALLSYRGREAYNATQAEIDEPNKTSDFRASSYQRYQGFKLSERFNSYSYHRITTLIDSHNIARRRGSVERALSSIKTHCTIIAISSDILYPVASHYVLHKNMPHSTLHVIESTFGHDGFLIEHEKLDAIVSSNLK